MKFKIGDTIVAKEKGRGFEKATVTGKFKQDGKQYYALKIMCGTATIPVSVENNYKIFKEKE